MKIELPCLEQTSQSSFELDIYEQLGVTPRAIKEDGKIHRFEIDKPGDKSGWYVFYDDTKFPCGVFGNWRTGEQFKWFAKDDSKLTYEDSCFIRERVENAEAQKLELYKVTADIAEDLYYKLDQATDDHPYLVKKQIKANEFVKVTNGDNKLVLPVFQLIDGEFKITSLQFIDENGQKKFFKDGDPKGGFMLIGDFTDKMFMCEGFATGQSIYESTELGTIVAFNAGNLVKVTNVLASMCSNITIVADNDESETGIKKANETGLPVILVPELGMDANDYKNAGNDLKALLLPEKPNNWLEDGNDYLKKPAPISWIIKDWIQENASVMIFGPSGCGKSFLLIDMLLTISTGKGTWRGNKSKKGNVVYLAGEGHFGLRSRIKLWAQENEVDNLGNFVISKGALDLDQKSGLIKTVEEINKLQEKPSVIAIDTFNRFFSGNENSAQEARLFIQSCTELQRYFNCTVIIVHHSGVNSERERGSTAIKASLESVLKVDTDDNKIMSISQEKMKDSERKEPLKLKLVGRAIDGWIDEDGVQASSAILINVEASNPVLKEVEVLQDIFKYNAQFEDGFPFITKEELKKHFVKMGLTSYQIKNNLKKEKYRFLGKLIYSKILQEKGEKLIIIDPILISKLDTGSCGSVQGQIEYDPN